MGKLVESTFVSLDGSIENPQNWSPALLGLTSTRAYAAKLLWDADALLLGRKTYEAFAEAWPPRAGARRVHRPDECHGKARRVHLARGDDLAGNATVLDGDTVEATRNRPAGRRAARRFRYRRARPRAARARPRARVPLRYFPSSPAAVSASSRVSRRRTSSCLMLRGSNRASSCTSSARRPDPLSPVGKARIQNRVHEPDDDRGVDVRRRAVDREVRRHPLGQGEHPHVQREVAQAERQEDHRQGQDREHRLHERVRQPEHRRTEQERPERPISTPSKIPSITRSATMFTP